MFHQQVWRDADPFLQAGHWFEVLKSEKKQLTEMQLVTHNLEDLQSSICCLLRSRKDGFAMFEGCTISDLLS